MNVIVSNKQKEILDNANIDAIKDLNGLFSVDDLVNKFKNYFFSKMILDATSVVDFATREVLQKLSDEIGSDRLIILLPSTPEPPEEFKKLLIDLKIYNFSNNIDDVVRFIEKPNTYESVINANANSYTGENNYYFDSSIKDGEDGNVDNRDIEVPNPIINNSNHSSLGDIMSSFNVYDDKNTNNDITDDNSEEYSDETISEEIKQFDNDKDITQEETNINDNSASVMESMEEKKEENEMYNTQSNLDNEIGDRNDNNSSYTFLNMDGFDSTIDYSKPKEQHVIGFRNITEHAGSTSLIYMLEKEAQKKDEDVISLEVGKNDFKLFRNSKMISVTKKDLPNTLTSLKERIVLVDLNDYQNDSLCNDIVYLIEPSTIKLNKLMMVNKDIFTTLKDKIVVLNKSMLSNDEIPILEKEAGMKFFFNIGPINDRTDNSVIGELLDNLVNYQ